jgi:uncharacterized protein (TIGR02246 family)
MTSKEINWLVSTCLVVLSLSFQRAQAQSKPTTTERSGSSASGKNADDDAIRKSARDFSAAFEKQDAKAIGAMWTEHGEYEDDTGKVLRGPEEIEQAYAELFKVKPGGKIEVKIQSIRFLTPDIAVEEGILRESSVGRELPSTTRYSAIDIREGGQWKIAQCREWGIGQDHLDDLNWLVGKWKGSSKEQELNLSFAWDEKQPILLTKLTVKPLAKSGTNVQPGAIKIGFDASRGGFHSWHSDQDGGQSRAQWLRDGNRWLINATGLTGDGKSTSAEYILSRIDNNNFTWRAVNRMLGDQSIPDSLPIKLTRVTDSK